MAARISNEAIVSRHGENRMNRRSPIRTIAAVGAALGLLAAASQVEAHASLLSATPAANSTGAAPKQVTLQFNEALVPKFFRLRHDEGGRDQGSRRHERSEEESQERARCGLPAAGAGNLHGHVARGGCGRWPPHQG